MWHPRPPQPMKQIIVILVLAALGWYGYGKYEAHMKAQAAAEARAQRATPAPAPVPSSQTAGRDPAFFTCDGRNQCSQMTSCEEARYFLKNCPGLSTEENREGASCEKQWCR